MATSMEYLLLVSGVVLIAVFAGSYLFLSGGNTLIVDENCLKAC